MSCQRAIIVLFRRPIRSLPTAALASPGIPPGAEEPSSVEASTGAFAFLRHRCLDRSSKRFERARQEIHRMSSTPSFAELGLRPELLRAVTEAGYTTPTPIQAQAIPTIMAGKDVMGGAQ